MRRFVFSLFILLGCAACSSVVEHPRPFPDQKDPLSMFSKVIYYVLEATVGSAERGSNAVINTVRGSSE